jgi:hypothetical protein
MIKNENQTNCAVFSRVYIPAGVYDAGHIAGL